MFKKNNIKKIFLIFSFSIIIFMLVKNLINQEERLKHYNNELKHLSAKEIELNQKKEDLLKKKEIVNTNEYIENVAREKCNMYMPNERVYININ